MDQNITSNELLDTENQPLVKQGVNWPQVAGFLGLTFGLTWALDLALYLTGGLKSPVVGLALQLQMLLPAFSAMLLGTFFYKNSPLYYRTNHTTSRWFTYYFMLLTLVYLGTVVYSLGQPEQAASLSGILLIPNAIGLVFIVVLRLVGGKNAFAGAGMAGGKFRWWVLLGIGFVAFYGLQTLLNALFHLGEPVDIVNLYPQFAASGQPAWVLMLSSVLNVILIGPILGLIIAFGEEYGWRGYLQGELTRLGKARGVLLLGVIWGIWHWPVIWMGYNYPGQPILGSLLMVGYTIALAFVLAYAVFKGRGVWIAAFLHALNNQVASFFGMMVYTVKDRTFSFGMGIPTLVICAGLIWLILRDPVWKEE